MVLKNNYSILINNTIIYYKLNWLIDLIFFNQLLTNLNLN